MARNLHVTIGTAPTLPTATMRIGVRGKETGLTQAGTWDVITATFGPANLTRGLFELALPTTCDFFTPAYVEQIPSFKSDAGHNMTTYVRSLRGSNPKIAFHHEPEADYTSGSTFVSQFNTFSDAAHAARPDVQFGMIAGGFQYNPGKNGADGSFLPPASKCDWYGFDTYRTGASTNSTGFGALIPLADVDEFQTWYGYVKDRGKPLYITEYGRGLSIAVGTKTSTGATWTQAQHDNALAKRPGLLQSDYLYLKGLGFKGINLWWNSNSPGDDWKFTDQPSIDAWSAVVAAETS